MKKLLALAALAAIATTPALAALKAGDMAPDFSAQGSLGGKDASFHLKDALKKGPVVVYFYPSAYTGGCDREAHAFAEDADKFKAAGATIVGVSADDLGRLKRFSADPAFCAGKFAIMSDADTKIAQSYDLKVGAAREGAKDVNKDEIGHAFIERVTYVIGKDGKIIAALSSTDDKLQPEDHVDKSLEIVSKK